MRKVVKCNIEEIDVNEFGEWALHQNRGWRGKKLLQIRGIPLHQIRWVDILKK
jgi:hypothetical protein